MAKFNKLRKTMGYADGGIVDLSPEEKEQLAIAKAKSEQGEEVTSPMGKFRSGAQSVLGKTNYDAVIHPEQYSQEEQEDAVSGMGVGMMGSGALVDVGKFKGKGLDFVHGELKNPTMFEKIKDLIGMKPSTQQQLLADLERRPEAAGISARRRMADLPVNEQIWSAEQLKPQETTSLLTGKKSMMSGPHNPNALKEWENIQNADKFYSEQLAKRKK